MNMSERYSKLEKNLKPTDKRFSLGQNYLNSESSTGQPE
jgi:hypothetical protein